MMALSAPARSAVNVATPTIGIFSAGITVGVMVQVTGVKVETSVSGTLTATPLPPVPVDGSMPPLPPAAPPPVPVFVSWAAGPQAASSAAQAMTRGARDILRLGLNRLRFVRY